MTANPRFSVWSGLILLALGLPVAYLALRWSALPATVPVHFDVQGRPDSYGSKWLLLGLAVALPAGVWLLFRLLPRLDPKRALVAANPNYRKLRLVVQALVGGAATFSVHAAGGGATAGSIRWLATGGLLLLALLGNYLSAVPPNYFVGIRTPWTLESPAVWARTHRLASRLFFWGGLLGAALALAVPAAATGALVVVAAGAGFGGVSYSYWLHQRLASRLPSQ